MERLQIRKRARFTLFEVNWSRVFDIKRLLERWKFGIVIFAGFYEFRRRYLLSPS
jgi:hypothetical protein